MAHRTTVEIEPIILKAVRLVAAKKTLRVKQVVNRLLRHSLARIDQIDWVFPVKKPTRSRDNGK